MRFNINNIEVANDKTRYTGLKDNTKNSMYFPNSNNMTMRGMSTPVKYYGVTDGMITDEGIAYPGQDFRVRGRDTVEFRMPMKKYQSGGRYIVGDQDVTELVNRYNTQGWEGLSEPERDFYMNNYDRIRTFDDSGMEVRHMPEATITANRGKWHSKYGDIPFYNSSKSPYSQQNMSKVAGELYSQPLQLMNVPGINMSNTSRGLRDKNHNVIRGTKFYESLNEYLKETGMGRVKSGFNSQSESSYNLWKNAMENRKAYPAYGTEGIMKAAVPVVGAGVAAYGANREQKQLGGRYNNFKNSLPSNLANTPESEYAMKRYWRSNQRPSSFQDAQNGDNPMFTLEDDNMYHAPSVDSRTNRFLKPKTHATVNYELDWYNSNTPEANEFRSNYKLVDNPLSRYYKYKKR